MAEMDEAGVLFGLMDVLAEVIRRHSGDDPVACYLCGTRESAAWRPHPLKHYPLASPDRRVLYDAPFCNGCATAQGFVGHRRPFFYLGCTPDERAFLKTRWRKWAEGEAAERERIREANERNFRK